jgi:uncharacterized membrane protein YhaH (DUF805 family)
MLEMTITLLAIVCSISVAVMCYVRRRRAIGFKSAVYFVCSTLAAAIALLNFIALFADGDTFVHAAALAYLGFATAIVLPAARALGNLTYETPKAGEKKDAPV